MSVGRILASSAAVLAVAGCTVLAVGMANAAEKPTAASTPTPSASRTDRPATPDGDGTDYGGPGYVALGVAGSGISSGSSTARPSGSPASHPASSPHRAPAAKPTPSPSRKSVVPPASNPVPNNPAPPAYTPPPAANPAPAGRALRLSFGTGNATRVITVTAGSSSSTTATLQAWTKTGSGWTQYGSPVLAHVGSAGLTWSPNEETSATPIGSFTLTQAFGYYGNPGTGLPYFQTNPNDYWISDKGSRFYNTHQRCGSCGYNDGINERLYYETPYYNYAVVIDANTPNAPGGVKYDGGSAFFLHVTDGNPTAGCVAIPQSRLVQLMKWLTPSAHPRILIGVV